MSTTVGLVLRIVGSRSEKVGQIAVGLLGAAWSIATYFVVPVLVVERAGRIEAVRRSLSVLRRTWGEAISAYFGIGSIAFLASPLGIMPIASTLDSICSPRFTGTPLKRRSRGISTVLCCGSAFPER